MDAWRPRCGCSAPRRWVVTGAPWGSCPRYRGGTALALEGEQIGASWVTSPVLPQQFAHFQETSKRLPRDFQETSKRLPRDFVRSNVQSGLRTPE